MDWTRPRLARVAAVWLVFQLALFVSVPTALCSTMTAGAVGAACTCDHADGQTCPMHHTRNSSRPVSRSRSCSCRSTTDPLALFAAALTGPPAVLTGETSAVAPPAPAA